MVAKSQIKATQNYVKKHYDRHVLTMPQGQKEKLKAAATARGLSVNAYILQALAAFGAFDAGAAPAGDASGAPAGDGSTVGGSGDGSGAG